MSTERPTREMLAEYIDRYCDERITEDELRQLEAWLASDSQCLEQFLLAMEIHSAMAWPTRSAIPSRDQVKRSGSGLAAGSASPSALPAGASAETLPADPLSAEALSAENHSAESLPTQSLLAGLLFPDESACPLTDPSPSAAGGLLSGLSMLFRPPLVFLTLLAAALAGGAVAFQWAPAPASLLVTEEAVALSPVAYLTSANGCDWGVDSVKPWSIGHSISSGSEIELHEGIAEFRLANGVSVGVEGPASLMLVSPTRLVLQYGKLTAHVPWEVTDFQVVASTCRLSACDAEFGVDATKSAVRIHSFVGETLLSGLPFDVSHLEDSEHDMGELEPVEESEQELPSGAEIYKTRIAEGRALALDISGEKITVARWSSARDKEFVARLPMTEALPVTDDYVARVLSSRPVHYWRFESLQGRAVANEIAGQPPLRLHGSLRLSGDMENRYADFGVTGINSYLYSAQPIEEIAGKDYSVEMWVKSCFSHRGGLLGLVPDPYVRSQSQRGDHGFLMELRRKREVEQWHKIKPSISDALRYLHRSPPGSRAPIGTNCWSDQSIHPRSWHHVVAVKENESMRLYVNGRLAGTNQDATPMAQGLCAVVGQTIAIDSAKQFFGQLDEISIYDRALTEEEVREHYQAVEQRLELGRSEHVKEI